MRAKDVAEFREYAVACWPRLLRTAYLLCGDYHEAEDLAQTTLEKAYVAWAWVRRSDDPDAYVRRILVNKNTDRFRRRRVRILLTRHVPERPTGVDAMAQAEQRTALMSALSALPPRQRAAVVLRFWEDLTESQVALVLQCSVGTVKSQTSKGLARLRLHPGLADHHPPATGGHHERTA